MTKSPPLVSVVMAVFNGERHVAQAVESILDQTFRDIELIIINDGSTDRTAEMLRPYVRLRNVRYHHQGNAGGAAARNLGIGLARGRYIAIQDHDDVSLPDRLEVEVAGLESDAEAELAYSPAILIDTEGRRLAVWGGTGEAVSGPEAFYRLFLGAVFIPDATVMMRRRHMDEGGPYDPTLRIGWDLDHLLRLTHDWPILELPRPLLLVRRGEKHGSLSSDISATKRAETRIRRKVFHLYRADPPVVTPSMLRRAMSRQYVEEGALHWHRGRRFRAICCLLGAAAIDPVNPGLGRPARKLGMLLRHGGRRIDSASHQSGLKTPTLPPGAPPSGGSW